MVSLTSVPYIEMYFGKWIHAFKAAGSCLFKASRAENFQTKLKVIIMNKMRMKQTTYLGKHVVHK